VPCCVALENSTLKMLNCELKGNKTHLTTGIIKRFIDFKSQGCLLVNCNVEMALCKIHNHRAGGIYMINTAENEVSISDSKIWSNGLIGIYCEGQDAKQVIQRYSFSLTTNVEI
jgi:hypothetical protein